MPFKDKIKELFKIKMSKGKILYAFLMLLCSCVFLFSAYKIVDKLYGYYNDNKQYEEIRAQLTSSDKEDRFEKAFKNIDVLPRQTAPKTLTIDPLQEEAAFIASPPALPYRLIMGNPNELDLNGILHDYTNLVSINSDMVGWINMPGYNKKIDYPVMRTDDNFFYLDKDFYKNYSYAGSIYMDTRNNPKAPDRHLIIYGHAMNDNSMLGNLKDFPDKPEEHTKNTKIYVDLLNTRLEYEVFSIYYENANINYRQTSFSKDEEYMGFLNRIQNKSVHDYKITLTPNDKILTLSTCNNTLGRDIRSVIHARLVKQITYDKDAAGGEGKIIKKEAKKAVLANVYLLELSISYISDDEEVKPLLNPSFNTVFKTFTSMVPNNVETISLNLETADPEAVTEITLNDQKADPSSLELLEGENTVNIKVYSRDWLYARTYTLTVEREKTVQPTEG